MRDRVMFTAWLLVLGMFAFLAGAAFEKQTRPPRVELQVDTVYTHAPLSSEAFELECYVVPRS